MSPAMQPPMNITHKEGCPEGGKDWYRAGGDCECSVCGKLYYDHPYCAQFKNENGGAYDSYYMHVLCNGDHVKL